MFKDGFNCNPLINTDIYHHSKAQSYCTAKACDWIWENPSLMDKDKY